MPKYLYKAIDLFGKEFTDTIEADSDRSAALKLHAMGYFPVSIVQDDGSSSGKKYFSFTFKKIKASEISVFTRRLADGLKGGLPLARALGVIERQTENVDLAQVTRDMLEMVHSGESLSNAMAKYPHLFSEMYRGMVRAGESAGLLESVLSRLAEFSEKEEDLRQRIRAAMAYPAVMLGVGALSVVFLLCFVIPKFEVMFQDLGQMIPLPTRILIMVSHTLRYGWWAYVPLIILTYWGGKRWLRTESGKSKASALLLKMPVVGPFLRKDLIAQFLRMLSVLLANGVPVLDCLAMARNALGNEIYATEIDRIRVSVKEGNGLVQPIRESVWFPPLVAEMIAVGDETGNLEGALLRVATAYEREVEYATKTMTSLLEPVVILVAGVVVCFIALSMLLPVFQMSAGIR